MPTTRPRHQITETPDVMHALEVAAQRWPEEPRSKLLLHLITVGGTALEERHAEAVRIRTEAIDATSGKYADAFPDGYLTQLRADWPE